VLVRGEETILIAPNSVIGLRSRKRTGFHTNHAAGRIALREGREEEVKQFEVETPDLAAVSTSTQFRVAGERRQHQCEVMLGLC